MLEGVPPPDRRTPGESGPDDAFDIPVSPEPGELGETETISGSEHTPKEWREKLRGLITGAKEKLGMSERGEKLKAYLDERSQNLQEGAKGLGPRAVEAVGSVIERYNKLNWKTKLAVTGVLMLGVSSTAMALPLVSGALTAALYGQRAIGAIGFGMNKRKALDAKIAANPFHRMARKSELAKNIYAAALAAVYMAGTSFIVHEGVEQLRSLGISDWFSGAPDAPGTEPSHTGPETEALDNTTNTTNKPPVVEQGATQPDPSAPASGEPASQTGVPIKEDLSVPGSSYSVDSENTINAPATTYAKPDDSLAAKEWKAEYAEPENLSAKEWKAEYAEPVNHTGAPDWRAEHTESDFAPEAPAPADTAPQTPIAEEAVAPNAVPADTLSATPETPPVPAPESNHFVVNSHGIEVTTSEPHLYADAGREHMFIYGGSPDQQARLIGQYFENPAHANHTLYGADASNVSFRIPWHMVNGEVLPGEPTRTGGILGFFRDYMEPPQPDEFAEIIHLSPSSGGLRAE